MLHKIKTTVKLTATKYGISRHYAVKLFAALFLSSFIILFQGGGLYAISQAALDAINDNHPFYIPCSTNGTSTTNTNTSTSSQKITLSYTDPSTNRTTAVTAYLPQGGGTYPVIMFAPGYQAKVSEYDTFLSDVAAAGFIVVGTDFTDNATAAGSGAHGNDIVDMKFIIGQIMSEPKLQGKIDSAAGIGVMGHSDGTFVASGVASSDSRVKAYTILNGGTANTSKPLLLVYGTPDPNNDLQTEYNGSASSYTAIVTLNGGHHFNYLQSHDGSVVIPELEKVASDTTATFFKRFLKADSSANIKSAAGSSSSVTFAEKGTPTPTGDNSDSSSTTTPATQPTSDTDASSSNTGTKANVFILGDSITSITSSVYKSAFQAVGAQITIDGSYGRGLISPAGGNSIGGAGTSTNPVTDGMTGMDILTNHKDDTQIKAANKIIVALGTNDNNLTGAQVDTAIAAIKKINSSAQIFWVDTATPTDSAALYPDRPSWVQSANIAIHGQASKDGYTVIPWFTTVFPGKDPTKVVGANLTDTNNLIRKDDGKKDVHPTDPAGIKALTDLVVKTVIDGASAQAATPADTGQCCGTTSSGPAGASFGGKLGYPAGANEAELATAINNYIQKQQPSSPMIGTGDIIVKYAKQYGVNPALFVGVTHIESGFGTSNLAREYPGNVWGATPGGSGASALSFGTMEGGIEAYFKNLTGNGSPYLGALKADNLVWLLGISTPGTVKNHSDPPTQWVSTTSGDGKTSSNGTAYVQIITDAYTAILGGTTGGDSTTVSTTTTTTSTTDSSVTANPTGPTIALDPGHSPPTDPNGRDPITGLYNYDYENDPEMNNAYTAATKIETILEAKGYKVFMTKNSATDKINLSERAQRANSSGASLLVTMHSNLDGGSNDTASSWLGYPDSNSKRQPPDGRKDGTTGLVHPNIAQPSEQAAKTMAPIIAQATGDSNYQARSFQDIYGDNGLQGNGKNTGNTPVQTILSSIPEVYSEVPQNLLPTDEFAQAMASAIEQAVPVSGASATTSSCGGGSSNGVVAGSIIKTAMGLAWDTPKNSKTPTDAYQAAWSQYDKGSNTTDCGAFVATVMISSGADPNYPKVGTSVQAAYVQKPENASKYTIINQPTSTSQLQPGDILIYNATPSDPNSNGHTEIYVGDQGFQGFPIITASLNDHTPQADTAGSLSWMLKQPNLIAVRLK